MEKNEFEQFVLTEGKRILGFCRMTAGDRETGDDLYQETMLKLTEKMELLDPSQNIKSYCLSVAILLWKNRRKKLARRFALIPMFSLDDQNRSEEEHFTEPACPVQTEELILKEEEAELVRSITASLPEKYRAPIYLYYTAELSVPEIAECLHLPVGTIKSRMRKAKGLLKQKLEALNYDR